MESKPVRLVDIARAAGVSLATASQVMNNSGRIADATRQRVLAAAERLDYRPNALARATASGRSRTIGILAENASGAFCMPVLVGTNRTLSRFNLASVLYDAAHSVDLRHSHFRELQARQVDGIVVIGDGADGVSQSISQEFAGPVAYAFGKSSYPADTVFLPDDEQAGRLAAEHLIGLGRTRLVHVSAEAELATVAGRARGFASALAAHGLQPAHEPIHGTFSRESGFYSARRLIDSGAEFDGIFAGNDAIAVGLAAELQASGRRVPDDVAIVGFDNTAGQAGERELFLTSIDPQLAAVGSRAVEWLVAQLDDDQDASAVVPSVECTLVTGRSTVGGLPTPRSLVLEQLLA